MFNMMNWIKLAGATIATLLVFLLGNWAANTLYFGDAGEEVAHAPEAIAPAAMAPAETAPAATAAADAPAAAPAEATPAETGFVAPPLSAPVADQIAAADLEAGAKVFLKCKACHRLDGKNGVGPSLDGIFGRTTGSVEGFKYSDANKGANVVWSPEVMNDYLSNPKTYMPGNKMTFVGLPDEADRINLIAWLLANGGGADGAAAAAPAAEATAAPAAAEPAAAAPAAAAPAATGGAPTLVSRLAGADVAAGGVIFEQCAACHNLDGTNSVGPYLNGVLGRGTAMAEGYAYSDANKAANQTWTASTIYKYLVDPQAVLPGTAMTFAGLPDDQDRINVIAWLLSNGGVAVRDTQSVEDALAIGAAQAAAAPATAAPAAAEPTAAAPAAAAPAAAEPATAPAAVEGGVAPISERIQTADLEAGAKVYLKCKACHKVDGKNSVGPALNGIIDRVSGTVPDFKYSDANKNAAITWTLENLDVYLADPKAFMPGNKMTFVGLPKPEDRANILAWLQANAM